jgi:serine phosphatase RsbU (regulator of sigma subunit)
MKTKLILCSLFLLLPGMALDCMAQRFNRDSLLRIINSPKQDTNTINALNSWGWRLRQKNPDSAFLLVNRALSLAEALPDIPYDTLSEESAPRFRNQLKIGKLALLNYRIGAILGNKSNYRASVGYTIKALVFNEKMGSPSLRCAILGDLGLNYWNLGEYVKALDYQKQALALAESIGDKKEISRLAGNLGILYADQGSYSKALEYYTRSMNMFYELNDRAGICRSLNNIAIVLSNKGDYLKALDYDFKAVKIEEEMEDKYGLARTIGNMGLIYKDQKNYSLALEYHFRALKLSQELDNQYDISRSLGNIGSVYNEQGEITKALNYNFWALNIRQKLKDKKGLSEGYAAIGDIYLHQGDSAVAHGNSAHALNVKYPDAIIYYEKAMRLGEEMGDKADCSLWRGNIAEIQIHQGRYTEAEQNLIKALAVADSIGALDTQKKHHQRLATLYAKMHLFEKSMEHFQKYTLAKDSVSNIDKTVEADKKAMAYEYEKKAALLKAEQGKKDVFVAAERQRQRITTYAISAVLLLVCSLGVLIYRSSLQKQKANTLLERKNQIIEHQKTLVEEKNRHITDSIQYAKRIQEAILPSRLFEPGEVEEHFIYYVPKDIISGDFYWRFKDGDDLFFAVVDCTGHGVPGAMMSMLGYDMLEYALKDKKLRQPGLILQAINNQIIAKLTKSSAGGTIDGMDITLCKFNTKANTLTYAGARNGLCIAHDQEIKTFPVDRRSIGDEEGFPFHEYTINLLANDTVYLFTDGYADQKGGPESRKFMLGKFHLLLKEISGLSCEKQQQRLHAEFNAWKGSESQRDDVLIVGIRLTSSISHQSTLRKSESLSSVG